VEEQEASLRRKLFDSLWLIAENDVFVSHPP
jgi:hypothetical protein